MPTSDMDFKWSDGSSSSLRKISDDLLRTRIQEVDEESDNYFPPLNGRRDSYDRRSSLGGVSSNDSLWADARRLSEAGVRRTSDHSVVLTEDTDSFIIGDRVWVGGTKPGQIAYIGETQFAPGEWAGIVLDDPIGKNDGSVGGMRYFQCESKKGVFSRLGRLTRAPLASPPSTKPTPSPTPPLLMSPSSSIKGGPTHSLSSSILKTPAPVSSPPSPSQEMRVGDRVIVSSSQGSKIGVLRFKGTTYFAPGEWCGIELDDPLGKNDGCVEGYRYFECAPKYGLFAQANKVTKSPAPNSRRQSCQLHHGTVRRHSSRESLISNTSSIRPPSSIIPLPKKVSKTSTSPSSMKAPIEIWPLKHYYPHWEEKDLI